MAWNNVFKPVFERIMQYIGLVIDSFDALLSALQGDLGPLQNILGKWLQFFRNTFNAVIRAAWNFVSGLWNTITSGIRRIGDWMYRAGRNLIWSIINGLNSIGWKIWDTILSFIPTMDDIVNAVLRMFGGWFRGGGGGQGGKEHTDFIARPGIGIQYFSPEDTIIGVKDVSQLVGVRESESSGTINYYIENVNLSADYTFDDFKRDLAEEEKDAWANRQNK